MAWHVACNMHEGDRSSLYSRRKDVHDTHRSNLHESLHGCALASDRMSSAVLLSCRLCSTTYCQMVTRCLSLPATVCCMSTSWQTGI